MTGIGLSYAERGQCGSLHPITKSRCVFGAGHTVGYHYASYGEKWSDTDAPNVSSANAPAPAPAVVTEEDLKWLRDQQWQDRTRAGDLWNDTRDIAMTPSMRASLQQQSLDLIDTADRYARITAALTQSAPGAAGGGSTEGGPWTCFHCDETFTDTSAARDHFGFDRYGDPACRIKIGAERGLVTALRKAESELADYTRLLHDENLEAYRMLASARSHHAEQLRVMEDLGYERGLADGRAMSEVPAHA